MKRVEVVCVFSNSLLSIRSLAHQIQSFVAGRPHFRSPPIRRSLILSVILRGDCDPEVFRCHCHAAVFTAIMSDPSVWGEGIEAVNEASLLVSNLRVRGVDTGRGLREAEARAVVGLLGKVALLTGPRRNKIRILLAGLSDIIDADMWVLTRIPSPEKSSEGAFDRSAAIDGGTLGDAIRMRTALGAIYSKPEDQLHQSIRRPAARQQIFTYSSRFMVTDEGSYPMDDYQPLAVRLRVNDLIHSARPFPDDTGHLLGFHRVSRDTPFTAYDCFVVHLIATEVRWLLNQDPDDEATQPASGISRRLSEVLLLLLAGDSKKQIAHKLELSYHTVDDYVKQLHDRYEVQSRGELLARFLAGEASVRSDQ